TGPLAPPAPPPFYWVTPDAAKSNTPPSLAPNLPDLSVQWIERTPRYQRYCLDYSSGLPDLCAGTQGLRRFPLPGEIVTFSAAIANQGTLTSPAASAVWAILPAAASPGVPNSFGAAPGRPHITLATLPPLAPGVTTTLTLTWPWQTDRFTVSLALDPAITFSEITRNNNQRSDATDALYMDVLVHPLIVQAFATRTNLVGSWSFDDWIQAQFDRMNVNLAAATYAAAPSGVLDRVRIDVITATEEVGGDLVSGSVWFDGRWTFRVEPNDPDTPEDESLLSAENYAQTFAGAIDWGLIHELTHQLGIIDEYNLNVAGSYQNQVTDSDGRPLLLGFDWPRPGLMGGGDVGSHTPWRDYGDHTALALNRNQGQRRGYFGEYLFDVPASNSLAVLDNRGQPLPGAAVAIFQTAGGVVQSVPIASGVTGADGRVALPNRSLPLGGITTATGHTLAPNPFGQIDVVGFGAQFLAQVSQAGQPPFYAWWSLTDFNLAYWQTGAGAYERELNTHLPAAGAPAAPPALDGRVDGATVSLNWTPSPSADISAYRIYRGQEPTFYPLTVIATTSGLSLVDTSHRTARYAVTAVDSQGRESGFSPIFRAPRTILPAAVTVNPTSGERAILDGHDGALLTQWADDRWVGRQGTVHLGLAGSRALVRSADGQLLAAVTGENRIKVLDSQRQLVNWFGQEGFVSGPLYGPSGVALASAPFTITGRPAADGQTLGLAPFDNSLKLSGSLPVTATGVSFTPGRFDGAVLVDGNDQLAYAASGHFDPNQGSVQMWARPDWPGADNQEHALFEALQAGGDGYRLRLAKADWNWLYAWFTDGSLGQHDFALYADVSDWQPGVWHHLALAWQPAPPDPLYRRFTFWVDGRLLDSHVQRVPMAGMPTWLSVGAGVDGRDQADASLDELFISGVARVGNSQQTRLLVSQSSAHRVDVLDWLGNTLSQFGGLGSGAGQFSSPQALLGIGGAGPAGQTILVADSGNGRIEALHADGVNLTWQAHWATGLNRPQGLARLPGDAVAASDVGDSQIKLLTPAGALLRSWSEPNDGHTGSFWSPLGLTLLPSGDLLVADTYNGRVVRIIGAVTLCYDFNSSGLVDVNDIQAVAQRWYDPGLYDARYDVIPDGVIDVVDVMTVAAAWNLGCA
ncbi:MAG: LamG-like jellyroll fold domain-containing protein, partial [Anaerolineae bacterium]